MNNNSNHGQGASTALFYVMLPAWGSTSDSFLRFQYDDGRREVFNSQEAASAFLEEHLDDATAYGRMKWGRNGRMIEASRHKIKHEED